MGSPRICVKTGAIGLRKAMIVGGTMELLGAITLGYGVSSTIQKGVAKINDPEGWACGYCDTSMSLFMVGMLSALFGAGMFLLMATFTSMPVSTTHAIVGAVLGITILGTSARCVRWGWHGLANIVASWFVSPVFSGLVSGLLMVGINRLVLRAEAPFENACRALPLLFGFTVAVVLLMILGTAAPRMTTAL